MSAPPPPAPADADAGDDHASLVVVGSANIDHCLTVARLPLPGETIAASALTTCAGGKGANQAAAAARLLGAGSRTRLVAIFGDDASGESLKASLRAAGVDLSRCRTSASPTGTAIIMLMPPGENSIVVAGGANQDEATWAVALAGGEGAGAAALLAEPSAPPSSSSSAPARPPPLLLQREVPDAVNVRAAELARAAGAPVVLDAGGDDGFLGELLDRVTVFSPNETELARGAGLPPAVAGDPRDGPAKWVVDQGWHYTEYMNDEAAKAGDPRPRAVLVKLGALGSALFSGGPPVRRNSDSEGEGDFLGGGVDSVVWQPAFRPDGPVVDTTGAGDCFTAAFAVARFVEGKTKREALRFATAAACLCVQRPGAQPSMPRRDEVEDLLRRREGESLARDLCP